MGNASVAVVIPCWNAEKWIARAIQSVVDQGCPQVECIVIDDGSTDDSLNVIRSFGDRVRWETGANSGAPVARNRGLALTGADYVLFLDADDYLEPDSLSQLIGAAGEADVVFGTFFFERGSERLAGHTLRQPATAATIIEDWFTGRWIASGAVLWRREFLQSIGGWDERLRQNEDGELALRAIIEGARFSFCAKTTFVYVQHHGVGRVSKRIGREVMSDWLDLLNSLKERAVLRGIGAAPFGVGYYGVAVRAFEDGIDDIGYAALRCARDLGVKGHLGSFPSRAMACVVGLRNKIRLVNAFK